MILISESLSRHSLVQILQHTISKNASKLPVFSDFDFRMALSPQPGADFVEHNFQKAFQNFQFLMILISKSLTGHSLVQILQHTT